MSAIKGQLARAIQNEVGGIGMMLSALKEKIIGSNGLTLYATAGADEWKRVYSRINRLFTMAQNLRQGNQQHIDGTAVYLDVFSLKEGILGIIKNSKRPPHEARFPIDVLLRRCKDIVRRLAQRGMMGKSTEKSVYRLAMKHGAKKDARLTLQRIKVMEKALKQVKLRAASIGDGDTADWQRMLDTTLQVQRLTRTLPKDPLVVERGNMLYVRELAFYLDRMISTLSANGTPAFQQETWTIPHLKRGVEMDAARALDALWRLSVPFSMADFQGQRKSQKDLPAAHIAGFFEACLDLAARAQFYINAGKAEYALKTLRALTTGITSNPEFAPLKPTFQAALRRCEQFDPSTDLHTSTAQARSAIAAIKLFERATLALQRRGVYSKSAKARKVSPDKHPLVGYLRKALPYGQRVQQIIASARNSADFLAAFPQLRIAMTLIKKAMVVSPDGGVGVAIEAERLREGYAYLYEILNRFNKQSNEDSVSRPFHFGSQMRLAKKFADGNVIDHQNAISRLMKLRDVR